MIFSNFFKHYIILIFFISLIELVKFTSPFDTSPIRRNGRRNSSSNNDRSPSRRRGSSRDRNRRLNGNAHGQGSLPYYNQYRRNHRNHIRDIQQRGRSYYRISFN